MNPEDEALREFESAANKTAIARQRAMEAAERTCLGLRIEIQQLTKERDRCVFVAERLAAERDAEKARAEKAEAACAFWHQLAKQCAVGSGPNGEYLTADDKCAAIDAAEKLHDCGKGFQSNDQIGKRVQSAFPNIKPSGGYDWIDELLGLLRVAHLQRDLAEKSGFRTGTTGKTAFGSVPEPDCGPTLKSSCGHIPASELDKTIEALKLARRAMEWYGWNKCSDHDCLEFKAVRAVNDDIFRLESLRKGAQL